MEGVCIVAIVAFKEDMYAWHGSIGEYTCICIVEMVILESVCASVCLSIHLCISKQ